MCIPPGANFLDQHAGGQHGPIHSGHFLGREIHTADSEVAGREADALGISGQAHTGIEHAGEWPRERCES